MNNSKIIQASIFVGLLSVFLITSTAMAAVPPAAKKGPVILKFKVPKAGVFIPAGQPIIIKGVSMEPNSTRTMCTVGLQTNGHGYGPTQGTGPTGREYVNWTGQTQPLAPGQNAISAELICTVPGVGPQIIKHVTHNVTATALGVTTPSTLPTVTTKAPHKAPAAAVNTTKTGPKSILTPP